MLYCHHGNLTISVGVRANLQLAVILLIIVQASSVSGRDPAIPAASLPPSSLPALVFDETLIEDAREGHATLTWTTLPEASTYSVSDADGSVLYNGAFPQAFVSGLNDGEHLFTVAALDAAGHMVAISQNPAVVVVRHWPMAQALALMAVGGLVFIALVVVLIYGAVTCRNVDGRVTHRVIEHRGDPQS